MKNRILVALFLLPLLAPSPSFAVTPDEAAQAITTRYRITRPAFLGGFNEIGTILMPLRDGLRANRPSNTFAPNVIKDRKLVVPGGGDLPLGSPHGGELKLGERLHLYEVRTGEDFVQLELFTVATYPVQGVRGPTPLQASIRFRYDGGLAAVTARQLLEDIAEWLAAEGQAPVRPEPSAAPPATPASPVPPVPAGTDSVHLGQSPEDVISVLGPPEKRLLLGPKTVFVYPRLNVIFIDGRLTDAE